jgi:uncharacterized repeat protein (TIGR03843 family)
VTRWIPAATSVPGATATSSGATELDLLARGEVTVKGRLPWSSNATLLVELALPGLTALGVYKPGRGERPLWDFPPGLFKREVAAYGLSEALDWGVVPPTVRREGPLGDGSLQLFVHADFEQHYFTLVGDPAHHERLRRICLLDLLTNNADRKSGHCLLGLDGAIWAIDNGLMFHAEPKLRTVIWAWGGVPIPAGLLEDLGRLVATGLPPALSALLERAEQAALLGRARRILAEGRFPEDNGRHGYPWPPV